MMGAATHERGADGCARDLESTLTAAGDRHLTSQGQDRKAEIVREAERLFTERGFTQTRMTDIADAAGVAKGLLYWYFENKQALLGEIVLDMRARLQTAQVAAIGSATDPLAQVYLGVVASVQFIRANQHVYGLINYSGFGSELGPALQESATVHARDAAQVIARGQASGVIRNDDSAIQLAVANAGVVNNYCGAASLGYLAQSDEELGHLAARYIVRAIAAGPELADVVIAEHGRRRRRRRKT
jgi:AcrR family transcriptional regulator